MGYAKPDAKLPSISSPERPRPVLHGFHAPWVLGELLPHGLGAKRKVLDGVGSQDDKGLADGLAGREGRIEGRVDDTHGRPHLGYDAEHGAVNLDVLGTRPREDGPEAGPQHAAHVEYVRRADRPAVDAQLWVLGPYALHVLALQLVEGDTGQRRHHRLPDGLERRKVHLDVGVEVTERIAGGQAHIGLTQLGIGEEQNPPHLVMCGHGGSREHRRRDGVVSSDGESSVLWHGSLYCLPRMTP